MLPLLKDKESSSSNFYSCFISILNVSTIMGLSQSDFCFYVYFTFYKRKKKTCFSRFNLQVHCPICLFFPPKKHSNFNSIIISCYKFTIKDSSKSFFLCVCICACVPKSVCNSLLGS